MERFVVIYLHNRRRPLKAITPSGEIVDNSDDYIFGDVVDVNFSLSWIRILLLLLFVGESNRNFDSVDEHNDNDVGDDTDDTWC